MMPVNGKKLDRARMALIGVLILCVLAAMESTVCAALPLPFRLPPGTPCLCLVFTLAVGFLMNESAGGFCGLVGGFLADAVGGEMLLLRPLFWMVMGWLAGYLAHRWLAHNLISFVLFCAVGMIQEVLVRALYAYINLRSLPSPLYLGRVVLPDWILTIVVSVLIYAPVKAIMKKYTYASPGC